MDLKTRCSTGTRGMLVISPTPGKDWLPGRAPWEVKEIPVMPRALMERVAKPKGMKSAGTEGYLRGVFKEKLQIRGS